jgi:hypothetical protein
MAGDARRGNDTFTRVKRGTRPNHARLGPMATLGQLEAATRAEYRGIPAVPADAPVWDWRVCGCDYVTPLAGGKPVRQAGNPAYQWTEEPNRSGLPVLAREVRDLVVTVFQVGYFHAKDAFRSFPGFPDCMIWSPGGRLVRELKGMTTDFYGQQLATLTTMRLAGDDVGVWRSCCLLSGRVYAELAAVTGTAAPSRWAVPGGRPAVSGRADPGPGRTRWAAGAAETTRPGVGAARCPFRRLPRCGRAGRAGVGADRREPGRPGRA